MFAVLIWQRESLICQMYTRLEFVRRTTSSSLFGMFVLDGMPQFPFSEMRDDIIPVKSPVSVQLLRLFATSR